MTFRVVESFSQLNFDALVETYQESFQRDGAAYYPQHSANRQEIEAQQDFYEFLRNHFFKTKGAVLVFAEENGLYYSAVRIEPYKNGMLLAGIETAPSFRGMGYAKRLLEFAVSYVHDLGMPIYSHIYKDNKASLSLHKKCGFTFCKDHAVFLDGSVSYQAETYCYYKNPEK